MTIRNMTSLLTPRTIALIGASERPGSIGKIVADNLKNGGFSGSIWWVNPRHTTIDGEPCFATVEALPHAPDLAVIATPPATIPDLIEALGRKGTRAAVVISAGVTAQQRQAMLDASRPFLLRIQGPNCLGLMLPEIGLNASFCHRNPLKGDLAFVSQSGALITGVVDWAAGRGIGFSHVISLGDMADIDFGDVLDVLAGDGKSRAILLYMEQLTHAPKFMSAARRAARAKPVVVIKAGRHAQGAHAAASHTGALAGADAAYDAAFRRAGLLRVFELQDLFNAAEILTRVPHLDGERLMILTNGGGAGVLAADRLADLGGVFATLPEALQGALDGILPPTWSHNNPVDIIGDANAERYTRTLEQLLQSDAADAILVMNCPTALASSTDIADAVIKVDVAHRDARRATMPLLTNWLGDGAATAARVRFSAAGIATFETPATAIEGFMQIVRYARAQEELVRTPPPLLQEITADAEKVRAIIRASYDRGIGMLTEFDAKAVLSAYGVPIAETVVARDADAVKIAARDILARHAACVIKILSDDITHKSDVGGVRLNLATADAAYTAARDMRAHVALMLPDARIDGFTVQPMIHRPTAHELIIGMSDDATFGPMLMFGAGGTAVEVIRDTTLALPPLDLQLARDMMRRTRIFRLLDGYRDRPKADLDAIALTLVRLSALVIAHPEIRDIDINPLLADDNGVIALDARIRIGTLTDAARRPLAIKPYPDAWQRRVNIQDIGDVLLRPIRPEDELLYEDLAKRIDSEDMRMRFFMAHPNQSHKMIARLTQIDYAREMAFVAIEVMSGTLLGVARFFADPDYKFAEYAVIVATNLKGRGLGWALMEHLIAYARATGLVELYGYVRSENAAMLQMCRALGFSTERDLSDHQILAVRLPLTSA
jgi:acetyltransferase